MRERFSTFRNRWLRLAFGAVVICGIVAFGGANFAQAAACSQFSTVNTASIYNFICPEASSPVTGNSYDNPLGNMQLLTNPAGGASDKRTLIAPGARVTANVTYHPDNTGTNVFLWIQTPAPLSVVNSSNNSGQSGPGSFIDSFYNYNGGSDAGCPAFWVGPQSPYQNLANAAAAGKSLGDYQTISSPRDGHTGCGEETGSSGVAAIWSGAGGTAGSSYTYSASYDILPTSPESLNGLCFSARVSASGPPSAGPVGPNAIANVKGRSNPQCFKVEDTNVSIKMSAVDNSTVPVSPRINRDCNGPGARPGGQILSFNSTGNYAPGIAKGAPYCLYAPPSYVSGGKTYTLSNNQRDFQIAGTYCGGGGRSSAVNWNCVGTANGTDTPSDNYIFNYTTNEGSVTVGGRVYDSAYGDGLEGATITMGSACNSRTEVSNSSGNYGFSLPQYAKFCLVPIDRFSATNNGYVYINPNPPNYTEQVAGADCRSYSVNSNQGALCTGWSTPGSDSTHISPQIDPLERYRIAALRSSVNDAACTGYGPGSGAATMSAGPGPNSAVIEDYENDQSRNGNYAVNEACVYTERLIGGNIAGPCLGGTGDRLYGSNYNGNDYRRCNQFGSPVKHSVWGLVRLVYRHDFQPYPSDHPVDNDYDFGYSGFAQIYGRDYNITDGQGYAGAGIQTCAAAYDNNFTPYPSGVVTTNANGDYGFLIARGSAFCSRDPNYVYNPRAPNAGVALDGPYLNPGYTQSGPCVTSETYECQTADAYAKFNYDFAYTYPVLNGSNLTKSVNVGAGTSVRPGDTLTYSINSYNAGSTTNNAAIEDFIPQNIDPATVTINSVTFDGVPQSCTGVNNGIYMCGYFSGGYNQPVYDCSPCISPTTPKSIIVYRETFPAGSTVNISWSGKVRSGANRDGVGVFPSDYRYCNNSTNWNTRGDVSTHSDDGVYCEDYSPATGLQAVVNFARVSYHWNPGPFYNSDFSGWGITNTGADDPRGGRVTPSVINPVPGDLAIAKSVLTEANNTDVDNDGIPEFDPLDPRYDNGTYTTQIAPDISRGPVEYQVMDQNNGANDFNAALLDPIIRPITPPNSCQPSATATIDCLNTVKWNFLSWPFTATPGNFIFDVTFRGNPPLGSTFGNTSKACYFRYWEPGHPVLCKPSNTVLLERARVSEPYFGALKGGVNAGGGIAAAPNGICLTDPGDAFAHGGIRANANSYGQYVVSAKGDIITSNIAITSQGGTQCRANIVKVVGDYANRGPAYRENLPSSVTNINTGTSVGGQPINQAAYPAGGSAKVVKTQGTTTISGLTVSRRWTLHVPGDLYIDGDITRDPAINAIANQPSLGIVVEGNVYISKNVGNIDALVFATGTINTCSFGPGRTLGTTPGYSVAQCKEKNLRVNGILMGKKIQFTRSRDGDGPNREAEIVELIGQAYILPPPGFNSLFGSGSSTTVQDRRPRF